MIKRMVKGNFIMLMVQNIRVIGKMENNMDKVNLLINLVIKHKVFGNMVIRLNE